MRKKKEPLSQMERLRMLSRSGLKGSPPIDRHIPDISDMPTLQERVNTLLGIVNKPHPKTTDMLFFVMYDIESNKVRREVAKYLIEKGCFRIQKSIFLAQRERQVFDQIKADLAEVQSLYDNHDSIILCPVASDEVRSMRVIGKNVDIDIITRARNTLFF